MALEPDDRGNGEHGACPAAFAVHAGVVGDELRRRRTATADGDKRRALPDELSRGMKQKLAMKFKILLYH